MKSTLRRLRRRRVPKVFGIGLIKTGTTSLGEALSILGYNHTHQNRECLLREVSEARLRRVFRWVDRFDSFEDWPWPLIYKQLDRAYPASKFILTVRDNDRIWYESVCRHHRVFGPTFGRRLFFGRGSPIDSRDRYLRRYREHNSRVMEHFADRPDKLLTVCWERGDAWQELCDFLEAPVPDLDFPLLNTAQDRLLDK